MSDSGTHWRRRLDELFHTALELPAGERDAFLRRACGGDSDLLADMRSLLAADGEASVESYEHWAPQVAAAWAAEAGESFVGRTLGRYRVIEYLGAGAMGEVYRAEDPALRRQVAVKVLPPLFAGDADRMRRFEREARTASALNHPNIVTIHEIGRTRGVPFIASELVEGETLRARIARGRVPLPEAIDIARQVAEGLAAAHAAGAIHRDIKPENLMIRRDGLVKIVDFGVAKLTDRRDAIGRIERETCPTRAGVPLGTLCYMSPEQALGQPLDGRSDLFSLGVVLYEMVTGELPFAGESEAARHDALLNRSAPAPSSIERAASPEVDRLVARALEKDRQLRYQNGSDFAADLKRLLRGSPPPGARRAAASMAAGPRWHHRPLTAALLVAAAVVSVAVVGGIRTSEPALDPAQLSFVRLSDTAGQDLFPSLSPDGRDVAYARYGEGSWDIYLHRIRGGAVNLTRAPDADDIQPVHSPDGRHILFRSERDGGGLFIMGITGESVKRVSDFGFDPAWSPDGRESVCSSARIGPTTVRLPRSELWVIDVASGRRRLLAPGPAYEPHWSPDGTRIAFAGADARGQRDIWTVRAGGGEVTRLTDDPYVNWNPVWSQEGRFLYFLSNRGGTMNAWRVRVDTTTGVALGDPQPFILPANDVLHLTRGAASDHLAWVSQSGGAVIRRVELDAAGKAIVGGPVELTPRSRSMIQPDISPDGTLLAVATRGEAQEDVLILRPDGTLVRALTQDEPRDRSPRWSPDGRRLAFQSDRTGRNDIFLINADGSGLEQATASTGSGSVCCPVWSPDGRRLTFLGPDLSLRTIDATRETPGPHPDTVLARLPDSIWFEPASWSPDGGRLAGQERRGNNPHAGIGIYDLRTGTYQSLTRVGGEPRWFRDGRRLVFQDGWSYHVLDTALHRAQPLLSVSPYRAGTPALTSDDKWLYLSLHANQADVWVALVR
jgi:eukaryotic-like serine/threonine-protein kinase